MNNSVPFWLASVDMGYGHQRAVDPLKQFAYTQSTLDVAKDESVSSAERRQWKNTLSMYEFFSRSGKIPIIGKYMSSILNKILHIPRFYPIRDLSSPTAQVSYLYLSIKRGLCSGMMQKISGTSYPLITSFYAPAIAADVAGYERVYCIICDTDLNRVWVAREPWESRIEYFAPCGKAAQRLRSYGVPDNHIHLTGFPLPIELLGDRNLSVLKRNLARRLRRLDPEGRFDAIYGAGVSHFLGANYDNCSTENEPFTITYCVGGAGAQAEIGRKILLSFRHQIEQGTIAVNLVAGIRPAVRDFFNLAKSEICPDNANVQIIFGETLESYFTFFNNCLHNTDVMWTKPSELSFFCGLGIPIIISPAIGPQEKFNRRWLRELGAGFKQDKPEFANQWLYDLWRRGRLAEAAWAGFLKARKYGTYKILDFLETGVCTKEFDPLKK